MLHVKDNEMRLQLPELHCIILIIETLIIIAIHRESGLFFWKLIGNCVAFSLLDHQMETFRCILASNAAAIRAHIQVGKRTTRGSPRKNILQHE